MYNQFKDKFKPDARTKSQTQENIAQIKQKTVQKVLQTNQTTKYPSNQTSN